MTAPTRAHPLISVVLPVRDGTATLDAALESLHAQTFPHFEVLVVDDGSRDSTPRIARAWELRDDRFRLVRSGSGGDRRSSLGGLGDSPPSPVRPGPRHRVGYGIVSALQRGLAESRGDYIARMDADDRCHPERLASQLDLLERRPGLAGCGTGVRYVPASTVTPRSADYAAWLNAMTDWPTVSANIFVECPLAHPTFMFRREALTDIGGYRDRAWPEDYDLLLRLWRRGHRFVSVPRVLLDWGNDQGRLSRNHPAYSLAAFRACRVHHLRRSMLVGREGVVVWGAGPTGKSLAIEFQRQEVRVAAFIEVDPRKIGQVIHGAPVCGADAARTLATVLHVGAVARETGREAVRNAAREAGLKDGADFVSMA
ncbi:MAG: glycosyltransferase [Gemmatimonadota bacterium]|nr:glycosyltransferase [Gemmatimonadota bacterium]